MDNSQYYTPREMPPPPGKDSDKAIERQLVHVLANAISEPEPKPIIRVISIPNSQPKSASLPIRSSEPVDFTLFPNLGCIPQPELVRSSLTSVQQQNPLEWVSYMNPTLPMYSQPGSLVQFNQPALPALVGPSSFPSLLPCESSFGTQTAPQSIQSYPGNLTQEFPNIVNFVPHPVIQPVVQLVQPVPIQNTFHQSMEINEPQANPRQVKTEKRPKSVIKTDSPSTPYKPLSVSMNIENTKQRKPKNNGKKVTVSFSNIDENIPPKSKITK